jgi:hypothetical protein
MIINALSKKYPKLYHMADKRNWDGIVKHGLLSTSAILDLYEYKGIKRFQIESQIRSSEFQISHLKHGSAIIRDQDPMVDRPSEGMSLEKCLVNLTTQEWFEFLNKRTFFWASIKGLEFMLKARLYRATSHYVFIVDTEKLLRKYQQGVLLTDMNTGSLWRMKRRSFNTFVPLSRYSKMQWVNEVTIEYSVPDIFDFTDTVKEQKYQGNTIKNIRQIWPV